VRATLISGLLAPCSGGIIDPSVSTIGRSALAGMSQPFDAYYKWLGIPPAEQPPNYYRLLGLTLFESDVDAITSAAEQRIAHVRTFQISQHAELSQRILNELAAARVCLLNRQKKSAYDAQLRRKLTSSLADIGNYAQAAPALRPLKSRATLSRPRGNRRLVIGAAAAVVGITMLLVLWFARSSRSAKRGGSDEVPREIADSSQVGEGKQLVGTFQPNPPAPSGDAAPLSVQAASETEKKSPQKDTNVAPPAVDAPAGAPVANTLPPATAPPSDGTPSAPPTPPNSPAPTSEPAPSNSGAAAAPTPPPPPAGSPPAIAPFNAEQAKQHQEAWAKHLGRPVVETNSIGMQMVLIPPGEFDMGSSQEEINRWISVMWFQRKILAYELPKHHVTITKPFRISAKKVTVADFRKYVAATKLKTERERSERTFEDYIKNGSEPAAARAFAKLRYSWHVFDGRELGDDFPALQITWAEASQFCVWLSEQTRERYRLPTEAEWEFACRAGTTTAWSFADDHLRAQHEVAASVTGRPLAGGKIRYGQLDRTGTKPPNPFGLYDMHGLGGEWCSDWFSEYSETRATDPVGPREGRDHTIRGHSAPGGSDGNVMGAEYRVENLIHGTRSASRGTDSGAGFRVVCEIGQSSR
jgi:formylglycine-generating enzyme required for sulfatase activity